MSSSKKKTAQQTIAISPKLKERIEKYVFENHQKFPRDKRFRSISGFYTSVMEQTLDCFEKGKTLDDFEKFVDSEIKDFFERISFNGLIPYYEFAIKANRYVEPSLEKNPFFYFTLRKLYTYDPYDIKSIKNVFDRIKNYILSNNLIKEYRLDIFSGKGPNNLTAVFEQVGLYRNLSFENAKFTVALWGLLGVKVTSCLYSEKDIYFRADLIATDLFYRNELLKRERVKLMTYNLSQVINYIRILEDKDLYLWMKIVNDKNAFISFDNDESKGEWINLIENSISKYGDKETHLLNLLRFFERLHWIEIENENELLFRIKLTEPKNQDDIEYLIKILSEKSEIIKIDDKYQLKKKES
ncbi:MAG: hypothetical protein ACFFD7_01925 [Candidatus Thorarchaeota archaeon]